MNPAAPSSSSSCPGVGEKWGDGFGGGSAPETCHLRRPRLVCSMSIGVSGGRVQGRACGRHVVIPGTPGTCVRETFCHPRRPRVCCAGGIVSSPAPLARLSDISGPRSCTRNSCPYISCPCISCPAGPAWGRFACALWSETPCVVGCGVQAYFLRHGVRGGA